MRFSVDMGGTFTDLVVEDEEGVRLFKSATVPEEPLRGVLDVLQVAADALRIDRDDMLERGTHFMHATTRALNAILTRTTARTAFLTTEGHPDILLFREGGRGDPFDHSLPYPQPYVPRALTFEIPERIGSRGEVVQALDDGAVVEIAARLHALDVEAVGVCLLWSIANPAHELRVGELLAEHLPGVPVTLSHVLNPSLREYRRASSTCIDASLKPLMSAYLRELEETLRAHRFGGRVLMVTSSGGALDASAVASMPIHAIGSGPAMAPLAGRAYATLDSAAQSVVVADTGGTSYDVSLVRNGRIPWTREYWLGEPQVGHITGFPAVDVKSIGAGGGSIAWVDPGGLLHVGPESAGSDPGPACYGRGGTRPTLTDAAVVLGFIDPAYFLGGAMELDAAAALRALETDVGAPLGLEPLEAASAVLQVATEHMVRVIEEITLYQGIDPRTAVLIGGGGAAGLNAIAIARRLGCPKVIVPEVGAALSAAGALLSDLTADYAAAFRTTTAAFDAEAVNGLLADLLRRCDEFIAVAGAGASRVELSTEARYPHQIWELELPLRAGRFDSPAAVEALRQDFHSLHEEVFAIADRDSEVELVGWRARVSCSLHSGELRRVAAPAEPPDVAGTRTVYFPETGAVNAQVVAFDALAPGDTLTGPAIVESPVTTIVVDPGATAVRTDAGSLSVDFRHAVAAAAPIAAQVAS